MISLSWSANHCHPGKPQRKRRSGDLLRIDISGSLPGCFWTWTETGVDSQDDNGSQCVFMFVFVRAYPWVWLTISSVSWHPVNLHTGRQRHSNKRHIAQKNWLSKHIQRTNCIPVSRHDQKKKSIVKAVHFTSERDSRRTQLVFHHVRAVQCWSQQIEGRKTSI